VLPVIIHGQISAVLLAVLTGGILLYDRGSSFAAAAVWGLVVLKPNPFILFLPALGLLLLTRRDWRGLFGLVAGLGALLLVSWLVQPRWLFDWTRVSEKTRVACATPTLWGLAFDLVGPEHWIITGIIVTTLMSAGTLLLTVRWHDDWLTGLCLVLSASLLVTPYL
jgi:hypothetical protein